MSGWKAMEKKSGAGSVGKVSKSRRDRGDFVG